MNSFGKYLKVGSFALIVLTVVFGCKKIENTSNSSVQETLLIRAVVGGGWGVGAI